MSRQEKIQYIHSAIQANFRHQDNLMWRQTFGGIIATQGPILLSYLSDPDSYAVLFTAIAGAIIVFVLFGLHFSFQNNRDANDTATATFPAPL